MKNAHGHRVYLSATARKLIKDVPRGDKAVWVFPTSFMGDYKHVGRRLAQRTRANIMAHRRQTVAPEIGPICVVMILCRTAASLMASGGVPRLVISRVLNHSEGKYLTSVYDRYSYDAEKRAAMEFWGRELRAILAGKPLDAVGRFGSVTSGT